MKPPLEHAHIYLPYRPAVYESCVLVKVRPSKSHAWSSEPLTSPPVVFAIVDVIRSLTTEDRRTSAIRCQPAQASPRIQGYLPVLVYKSVFELQGCWGISKLGHLLFVVIST